MQAADTWRLLPTVTTMTLGITTMVGRQTQTALPRSILRDTCSVCCCLGPSRLNATVVDCRLVTLLRQVVHGDLPSTPQPQQQLACSRALVMSQSAMYTMSMSASQKVCATVLCRAPLCVRAVSSCCISQRSRRLCTGDHPLRSMVRLTSTCSLATHFLMQI